MTGLCVIPGSHKGNFKCPTEMRQYEAYQEFVKPLTCKAGDVDSLVDALKRGLDNPEARARIGEAGRQRVLERWTWRLCAEQTVEQYREVLAMPANIAKLKRNGRI